MCAPPLGDGRGIRKIPPEMSDIRQFTPVAFLQLSRIARQGLSLCTAKIAFFPEVFLFAVYLVLYFCSVAQLGEWGRAPILDKLESFVVNAIQYVVSEVSDKKTPRFASGSFYFVCIEMLACISTLF